MFTVRTGAAFSRAGVNAARVAAPKATLVPKRVSMARQQVPLTLYNASSYAFKPPAPGELSHFLSQLQRRNASHAVSPGKILRLFQHASKEESPSAMSAAKLFAIKNGNSLLANLSPIVDTFFPVDAPGNMKTATYLTPELQSALKQNAGAKQFQLSVLQKVVGELGFNVTQHGLQLKSDFSISDCQLLATPNGRSCLGQMIRSMHLCGNENFALDFQVILLSLARRYNIAPEKMLDIAYATQPNFWQLIDRFKANTEIDLKRLLTPVRIFMPVFSTFELQHSPIDYKYLSATGNQTADFLLGHDNNHYGQNIRAMLQHGISNQLHPFSTFALTVFPTQDNPTNDSALPVLTRDTQRCFRANPLLRKAHRLAAQKTLAELGLDCVGKEVSLKANIHPSSLNWLEREEPYRTNLTQSAYNKFEMLLRMLKSLYLLSNEDLARNLKDEISGILSQHYYGSDATSLLARLETIFPSHSKKEALIPQSIPKAPYPSYPSEPYDPYESGTSDVPDAYQPYIPPRDMQPPLSKAQSAYKPQPYDPYASDTSDVPKAYQPYVQPATPKATYPLHKPEAKAFQVDAKPRVSAPSAAPISASTMRVSGSITLGNMLGKRQARGLVFDDAKDPDYFFEVMPIMGSNLKKAKAEFKREEKAIKEWYSAGIISVDYFPLERSTDPSIQKLGEMCKDEANLGAIFVDMLAIVRMPKNKQLPIFQPQAQQPRVPRQPETQPQQAMPSKSIKKAPAKPSIFDLQTISAMSDDELKAFLKQNPGFKDNMMGMLSSQALAQPSASVSQASSTGGIAFNLKVDTHISLGTYLGEGGYSEICPNAATPDRCPAEAVGGFYQDATSPNHVVKVLAHMKRAKNIDTSPSKLFNHVGVVEAYNAMYGAHFAKAYVYDAADKSQGVQSLIFEIKDRQQTWTVDSAVCLRLKKLPGKRLKEMIIIKEPLPPNIKALMTAEYKRVLGLGVRIDPSPTNWIYDPNTGSLSLVEPMGMLSRSEKAKALKNADTAIAHSLQNL